MSSARGLDPLRWIVLPALQALAACVLFALPFRLFGLQLPEPVFPMALAFAWAVIRPSILAPFVVLLLGLALDHLWGGARGLWPVCLLVTYGLALGGRSMMAGQGLAVLWAWYAALTAVSLGTGWLLTSMLAGAAPEALGLAWQFLATIVLYPFAGRLIEMFEDADVRFR